MPEKVKGKVKWFSNRKGFGFVSPDGGGDDIFLHHSRIVSDADYKTLRDGYEVEFEVGTDDNGKPFADKITSADGLAIPASESRKRNKKNKDNNGNGSGEAKDENEASKDDKASDKKGSKSDNAKDEGGSGKKKGRNRNKKEKPDNKDANNNSSNAKKGGKKSAAAPKTWHSELEESVQKSMADRSIKIEAGRAFVSLGDSRLKVGTGGYITLAHASGMVAEGTYTCSKDGKVMVTWQHVLKLDGEEWKLSSVEEQNGALVKEFSLTDDAVTATGADENPETLWGSGKPDPKESLEKNGFQMRKVALNAAANPGRRGRGPRNRKKGPKKGDGVAE